MKKRCLIPLLLTTITLNAQVSPEISSWIRNTTGATGYNGIPSNVQTVQYSTGNVYISCTCIPGYSIGPWMGPNVAANQNFVFRITRNPQQNTGTPTVVGLGHTGVWTNGVSIFNADDGQTYNNQGVWHRNAFYWEEASFDNCLGHPQQNGEYHHHVNPKCLYDDLDSTHHSPIIGYAFDGFPVYGAYAWSGTDGTGTIKRMRSSYRTRNMTDRTTLPDGSAASSAGPVVSGTYPLGAYIQDYEYVPGLGDLDERNGRFCITPDYPAGIYAYFVTIDSTITPVYPYTMAASYYGTVQSGNTGPGSGHNTITEATTVYNGTSSVGGIEKSIQFECYPIPAGDYAFIRFAPESANNIEGRLYDSKGQLIQTILNMQPSISYTFDLSRYPGGIYLLHLQTDNEQKVQKITVVR